MDTPKQNKYSLFSVLGIEIEYMVVSKQNLNIYPIVDKLFQLIVPEITDEIPFGSVALNNELALHVVELKTNGPTADIVQVQLDFNIQIQKLNSLLDTFDAKLMPTGMHPWLDPLEGIKLWPHGQRDIYKTYDKIFDCRGHGWSNLQSVHINMPFANDSEFVKLNNAIRVILPIIPALCSSTPVCESLLTGYECTRMMYYINNQKKIPSITGDLIPEAVLNLHEYHQNILHPMYRDIAPHDPSKLLQEEWLNSRGAIARFERDAIEIRIVDTQECALADFAMVAVVTGMIRYIIAHTDGYMQNPLSSQYLKGIILQAIKSGMQAEMDFKPWVEQLGLPKGTYKTAKHLLNDLIDASIEYIPKQYHDTVAFWLSHGNLAERIMHALSNNLSKDNLMHTYGRLCTCLQNNELFTP